MDDLDVEYTVLRRRQQDLLREAENRRLVRALRESRKSSHEDTRGRKVLSIAVSTRRVAVSSCLSDRPR